MLALIEIKVAKGHAKKLYKGVVAKLDCNGHLAKATKKSRPYGIIADAKAKRGYRAVHVFGICDIMVIDVIGVKEFKKTIK